MAHAWEITEKNCYNYLKDTFSDSAVFEHRGGSDASHSDILVKTHSGKQFYIEAKSIQSQSGQFVLLPEYNTQQFVYSPLNKSPRNEYTSQIINYMNSEFDNFCCAGTQGLSIALPKEIFYSWAVTEYLYIKKAEYFIVQTAQDFVLFPTQELPEFFDISACYRIKKSGSSEPARKDMPLLTQILMAKFNISDVIRKGKKLFVRSTDDIDNQRIIYNGHQILLSRRSDIYEVRKLSNTKNANVIFSIKYAPNKTGLNTSEFTKILQS